MGGPGPTWPTPGSATACASSFEKIETVVPRLSVLLRGSFTIENEAESDSLICYSCLDVHDQHLDTKRRDHDDNINVCYRQRDEKEADKIGKRERGNETIIIVKIIIVFLTKES